eukprot:193441-Amphidinium_carterae.1
MCPVDLPQIEVPEDKWTLNAAGVQCTPWSSFGSREGVHSIHMLPYHAWLQRCIARRHTFIMVENSSLFPERLLLNELNEKYECRSLIFNTDELGMPVKRKRMYFFAVLKEEFTWHGPSQSEMRAKFMSIFGRKPIMSADDLITDSEEHEEELWKSLCKRRRLSVNENKSRAERPLLPLLTQQEASRYQKYQELYMKARVEQPELRCFVADLHQNPDQRQRCTSDGLFTQISHGLVYSFTRNWLLTPRELLQAHCWNKDAAFLKEYSVTELQRLIGNGMHLHALTAWILFCLGHVEKDVVKSEWVSTPSGHPTDVESMESDSGGAIVAPLF